MDFEAGEVANSQWWAKSAYERFMIKEGLPVLGGFGVSSVRDIPMAPWRRLGCEGAYLRFYGSDGVTGMYAGRIAPGGETLPERHLYEKMIYILHGHGVAEIQQRDRVPQNLLWQPGSLFSPPLNTLHRLINHSDRPALFLAVTTAPMALDHYRNEEFIFHNDFIFNDRYAGEPDYFAASQARSSAANRRRWVQRGNFVADVRQSGSGRADMRASQIKITRFEMARNSLIGQLVEWPVGRYRKAHCRGGGVALLILRSSGYSLIWPSNLGSQPYKNGLADQVVRQDWAPGSILSPPPNWFHQHFNTGAEPAQTLAFYCGSEQFPMSRSAEGTGAARELAGRGGLLELAGDDPSIRRMYAAELASKGIVPAANLDVAANDD
jgi:oxalate decarboxylase/phosphoglucose isomerase-like protein (cupin superfamily)